MSWEARRDTSEMIWATFEHLANAPNDAYSYRNAGGGVTSITRDTAGTWLFCPANSTGPFNRRGTRWTAAETLLRVGPTGWGPDTVLRTKAWGAASEVPPNPLRDPPAVKQRNYLD